MDMDDYEPTMQKHTQFFSTGIPRAFWCELRDFVRDLKEVPYVLNLTGKP